MRSVDGNHFTTLNLFSIIVWCSIASSIIVFLFICTNWKGVPYTYYREKVGSNQIVMANEWMNWIFYTVFPEDVVIKHAWKVLQ